jgi:hypothetical protein
MALGAEGSFDYPRVVEVIGGGLPSRRARPHVDPVRPILVKEEAA